MPKLSDLAGVRGPAFRVNRSLGTQAVNTSSATKVTYDTEVYDTNNNFVIGTGATESRFTPTVAGYYQINAALAYNGNATAGSVQIYKNGAVHSVGAVIGGTDGTQNAAVSDIVLCNGTTDFIEIYTYHSSSIAKNISSSAHQVYFSGCFIRPA